MGLKQNIYLNIVVEVVVIALVVVVVLYQEQIKSNKRIDKITVKTLADAKHSVH